MTTSEWVQIILTGVLVVITGIYAWRTFAISNAAKEQADASVETANEMREQTIALYKPHIILEKGLSTKGEHFVKLIGVAFSNAVGGPALNLEIYIAHPLLKIVEPVEILPKHSSSLSVGEHGYREFLAEDNANVHAAPIESIPIVINYEDVLGNHWHSTLQLVWKAAIKDVVVGRMQVAVPGRFKEEDSNYD